MSLSTLNVVNIYSADHADIQLTMFTYTSMFQQRNFIALIRGISLVNSLTDVVHHAVIPCNNSLCGLTSRNPTREAWS